MTHAIRNMSFAKRLVGLALAAAVLTAPPLAAMQERSAAGQAAGPVGKRSGTLKGAPEINPYLAVAGGVLVIGGALVLTTRRRKATA